MCIIMVGHWPFTFQNVSMAVHFSLTPDKTSGQLQIVAYTNNHLHYLYISVWIIVNIITATQAIVYTKTTYIIITVAQQQR